MTASAIARWTGDIGQTQLGFGWRTPATLDQATPVSRSARHRSSASGRASRLYRAVREQKLASSVSAYDYTPTSIGVFVIHAEIARRARRRRRARDLGSAARRCARTALERGRAHARASACTSRDGCAGSRTWKARPTISPSGRRSATGVSGEEYFERFMTVTADDVQRGRAASTSTENRRRCRLSSERASQVVAQDAADDAPASRRRGRSERAPDDRRTATLPRRRRRRAPNREGRGGCLGVSDRRREFRCSSRRKAGAPMASIGVFMRSAARAKRRRVKRGSRRSRRARCSRARRTRTAAQIAEEAELLGGVVSASAGSESFGWSSAVPKARLPGSDRAAGRCGAARPTIPDDAFETERAIALADRRDAARRHVPLPDATREPVAFAGHPYGVPATGTSERCARSRRSRLREWHRVARAANRRR